MQQLLAKPKVFFPAFFFSRWPWLTVDLMQEVVGFSLELTIGDALDVMGHYEIFSVAVVNAKGHAIGQVDYLDLLCALVRLTAEADQVRKREGRRKGGIF